jgi:hypothetical protein
MDSHYTSPLQEAMVTCATRRRFVVGPSALPRIEPEPPPGSGSRRSRQRDFNVCPRVIATTAGCFSFRSTDTAT